MALEPTPPPPGLLPAAQAALKKFLPSLDSAAMKERHGFAATDDFSAITLGEPFAPAFLTRDAIEKSAETRLEELLRPGSTWYFPVHSGGKLACLLSVQQRKDGSLIEDKLGMPQLAGAWAAVREAWPAAKGFTPLLVIVPTHQRFYFSVPQASPPNLTPLQIMDARAAMPATHAKLTPAAEALSALRN